MEYLIGAVCAAAYILGGIGFYKMTAQLKRNEYFPLMAIAWPVSLIMIAIVN